MKAHWSMLAAVILIATLAPFVCLAAEPQAATETNSLIDVGEVLQGRIFENKLDRDVFFLRAVQDRYPSKWPALLQANITLEDYISEPAKMLRFISELGLAMNERNDVVASTNLVVVLSNQNFFTNELAYRPEIFRATVQALIRIGPNGRKALGSIFTENRYRDDSGKLEKIAAMIGAERPPGPELADALSATAFKFSTPNGGIYPRCTTEMAKNLLLLPEGAAEARIHLNTNEIFDNPARFQAVIEGIQSAHAAELAANLVTMSRDVSAKLATLTNSPGPYRDDLQDLCNQIQTALQSLKQKNRLP